MLIQTNQIVPRQRRVKSRPACERRALVAILIACGVAFTGCKSPRNDSVTADAGMDSPAGTGGASGAGGSASAAGGAGGQVSGNGGGGAAASGGMIGSASGGAGGGQSVGGTFGSGGALGVGGTAGGQSMGGTLGAGGSPATCAAGAVCGTTCKPGVYDCSSGSAVCIQKNETIGASCGTTGMVCDGLGACISKIANGNACMTDSLCQSGICSVSASTNTGLCCQSGQTNCGSCVDRQTDANNCGVCGTMCGANKACVSSACVCGGLTLACGGCGSWAFDSGTTEGWVKDTNPNFPISGGAMNGVQNITVSATMKHDGTNALAVPINVDFSNASLASIAVPLCSSTMNLAGYTVSAWLYFAGPAFDADTFVFLDAWSASDSYRSPVLIGASIAVNSWISVSLPFPNAIQADHLAINLNPGTSWSGTLYVDSVALTGP